MDTSKVIDDILEHHGVKGMKWGQRRAAINRAGNEAAAAKRKELGIGRVTSGLRPSDYSKARQVNRAIREARKTEKAQLKFEKRFSDPKQYARFKIDLHNATLPVTNASITRINSKPEYRKASDAGIFHNDNHPVTKKYHDEIVNSYVQGINDHLASARTPKGQGLRAERADNDFLGFTVRIVDDKVHHADSNIIRFNYIKDSQGQIIGLELAKDSLAQSAMLIEDILEHHGVKGQKWGVRRKATVGPQEVIVRDSRLPGRRLKTSGGGGHPATQEAVRSRQIGQISKKSGLKALTNKELEDYNRRLNLEQQAKRLRFEEAPLAQKFVLRMLGQAGSRSASRGLDEGAKAAGRKALKLAAAAAA